MKTQEIKLVANLIKWGVQLLPGSLDQTVFHAGFQA
jgi:hypothetical protein